MPAAAKQELVPTGDRRHGRGYFHRRTGARAAFGGVGHISDAMVPTVSDRRFDTGFVAEKLKLYKYNVASSDKSPVQFNLGRLAEATQRHIGRTMRPRKDRALFSSTAWKSSPWACRAILLSYCGIISSLIQLDISSAHSL